MSSIEEATTADAHRLTKLAMVEVQFSLLIKGDFSAWPNEALPNGLPSVAWYPLIGQREIGAAQPAQDSTHCVDVYVCTCFFSHSARVPAMMC
jgi:hypothetical protein